MWRRIPLIDSVVVHGELRAEDPELSESFNQYEDLTFPVPYLAIGSQSLLGLKPR